MRYSDDICKLVPISMNKHSFEDGIHHVFDLVLIFLELENEQQSTRLNTIAASFCSVKWHQLFFGQKKDTEWGERERERERERGGKRESGGKRARVKLKGIVSITRQRVTANYATLPLCGSRVCASRWMPSGTCCCITE